MSSAPDYQERLGVPLRWWVQGTMLVATMWLAMIVAIPGVLAWAFTVALLALLAGLLAAYGRVQIVVFDNDLRVGRAHVDVKHLGTVSSLDAEQTRRIAGVEADARAHLVLRPYLKRAVRVEITDRDDPVPYWLVSTRHPDRLAVTLAAARDRDAPPRAAH